MTTAEPTTTLDVTVRPGAQLTPPAVTISDGDAVLQVSGEPEAFGGEPDILVIVVAHGLTFEQLPSVYTFTRRRPEGADRRTWTRRVLGGALSHLDATSSDLDEAELDAALDALTP